MILNVFHVSPVSRGSNPKGNILITKQHHRASKRTTRVNSTHTYYDKVDEYNNREFYLYTLGRYHNKIIFCYGETSDIAMTEMTFKSTFPVYKKIVSYPVEDNLLAKSEFESFIQEYKIAIPIANIANHLDAFTISDTNTTLSVVLQKLNNLYNKQPSESRLTN